MFINIRALFIHTNKTRKLHIQNESTSNVYNFTYCVASLLFFMKTNSLIPNCIYKYMYNLFTCEIFNEHKAIFLHYLCYANICLCSLLALFD